jgi:hypothetical protein
MYLAMPALGQQQSFSRLSPDRQISATSRRSSKKRNATLLQCHSNPLGGVIIAPPQEPQGPQTGLGWCGSLEAHPTWRFGMSNPNQESIQCLPVLTCPSSV